jgi:hypothetical protein
VRGTIKIPKNTGKESDRTMDTNKIMATLTILMIGLSIAGFAYAHWTSTAKIEGTIHMGELIVGILSDTTNPLQNVTWYETTNGVPEGSFSPAKPWVANASVGLSDLQTSAHHVPPVTVAHTMTVSMVNAYPQWDVHIAFFIKNGGTIPANFTGDTFTGQDVNDSEALSFVETTPWYWDAPKNAWIDKGYMTDGIYVIMNVNITAGLPHDLQTEPCNHYPVTIDLEFAETAEMCHYYTFSWETDWVQWNAAVLP